MEALKIIKFKDHELKRNFINDLPYNPKLKEFARKLRKSRNLAEVLFWNEVKSKKFHSLDFDRQIVVHNYIIDFYIKSLGLAIEIDGDSHDYKYEEDLKRQEKLESLGVLFLRFLDVDVKKDMNNVLREIEHWVLEHKGPTPSPSKEGS